jgi:UDP-glucose 6-dehydrogenase
VIDVLDLDNRIGKNLSVPDPDGDCGFGGKCFPKDFNALIKYSESIGYNPEFFKEVWESNKRFRNKEDWKDIAGATSENKNFN